MEVALEPDLPIVDAHHHIWDDAPQGIYRTFPIEVLAAERAASGHDIRATVFVDCHYSYLRDGPPEMRAIGETRAVEADAKRAEAMGERGLAAGIVSHVDMNLGAAIEPVLLAHIAESPARFRGVRQITPWHPGMKVFGMDGTEELLRSSEFRDSVAVLARYGLTFDTYVLFPQLGDVAHLARSVPEATIILDHAGVPRGVPSMRDDEADSLWRKGLADVAACPNVVVKLGGLLMHHEDSDVSSSKSAAAAMREHILPLIELFTPDRCMFESNFPVDALAISYGNLWNAFKRITTAFSLSDRLSLFSGTAARVYRLNI